MIAASLALFDKAGIDLPLAVMIGIPAAFLSLLAVRAVLNSSRRINEAET